FIFDRDILRPTHPILHDGSGLPDEHATMVRHQGLVRGFPGPDDLLAGTAARSGAWARAWGCQPADGGSPRGSGWIVAEGWRPLCSAQSPGNEQECLPWSTTGLFAPGPFRHAPGG